MEGGGKRGGGRKKWREGKRQVASTLTGKLPQAAPDSESSGKNRVSKTGVKRKKKQGLEVFLS